MSRSYYPAGAADDPNAPFNQVEKECEVCNGTGDCWWCDGTGEDDNGDECLDCDNTKICDTCNGTGIEQ